MNDINKMPPKCQYCPYWEVCKYPWVCPDIGDKKPKRTEKRTETHASDCISRQALCEYALNQKDKSITANDIMRFPSAQPEQQWIPFETRPLTEEEKEEHPEWDCILNCKLPDDGQRILVAIRIRGHEEVQQDEFYSDDGSYLDSGYEIGTEAVAWMPLPKPYKEDDHEIAR